MLPVPVIHQGIEGILTHWGIIPYGGSCLCPATPVGHQLSTELPEDHHTAAAVPCPILDIALRSPCGRVLHDHPA